MNTPGYMRGARAFFAGIPAVYYIVIVLAVAFGVQTWRVRSWQNTAAENALALSNEKARTDITRASPLSKGDSAKLLGDSLTAVEHLAIQTPEIRTDALDKALKRQTATIASLTAQVQQLTARGTAVVVGDTGTRTATFDIRREPYTAHAVATLPAAPRAGSLDLSVMIDAVHLVPRVQCGKPDRGISPATVEVTGPKWLSVKVDSAVVASDVCHSPALAARERRLHLSAFGGYGISFGGTPAKGPVIGLGAAYDIW